MYNCAFLSLVFHWFALLFVKLAIHLQIWSLMTSGYESATLVDIYAETLSLIDPVRVQLRTSVSYWNGGANAQGITYLSILSVTHWASRSVRVRTLAHLSSDSAIKSERGKNFQHDESSTCLVCCTRFYLFRPTGWQTFDRFGLQRSNMPKLSDLIRRCMASISLNFTCLVTFHSSDIEAGAVKKMTSLQISSCSWRI